jgi:hypothetical protein
VLEVGGGVGEIQLEIVATGLCRDARRVVVRASTARAPEAFSRVG